MTAETFTAYSRYILKNEAMLEKLAIINEELKANLRADKDSINWAHVGDLARIESALDDVIEIMGA